ncbi:MAG: family 20 glycosylhydrolase [Kiritimatiellae bacterium]|nr:family 20 glycosylhydrolase [Kiritimatiellia bacterium]
MPWRFQWPVLIPDVRECAVEPARRVAIRDGVAVEVACPDAEAPDWVSGKMKAWFGAEPAMRTVPDAGRTRSRATVGDAQERVPPGDEAYALSAKDGTLLIEGRTMQGVRWAMHTLRQIAQPARGTFRVEAYEVPEFSVRDWPDTAFRALHICAFPEYSPVRIERVIRMAAYYKFNYVILESWGVFRSERHPWHGWRDGWLTPAECRRLASLAKDLGVTLVPFFNVFGHATAARGRTGKNAILDVSPEYQPLFEPVEGFNWCISNPEARHVIRDLVGELHEAFERPPYFHLGCDEAEPPSCAICCAPGYGARVAEHVRSMAEFVRSLGARPMMWHDMLLRSGSEKWRGLEANGSDETVALLETLPKDTIICDWHYGPASGDGLHAASLDHFISHGFDTMTCPWDDPGGIAAQCGFARQRGLGVICTTWNHLATYGTPKALSYAAACAWSEKASESVKAADEKSYCTVRFVFSTHWRQIGWDTPGADRYAECGFLSDQATTSIGER